MFMLQMQVAFFLTFCLFASFLFRFTFHPPPILLQGCWLALTTCLYIIIPSMEGKAAKSNQHMVCLYFFSIYFTKAVRKFIFKYNSQHFLASTIFPLVVARGDY